MANKKHKLTEADATLALEGGKFCLGGILYMDCELLSPCGQVVKSFDRLDLPRHNSFLINNITNN